MTPEQNKRAISDAWKAFASHDPKRIAAMLANGRTYDNDYCFIFELRDGLIARVREYMDTQKGRACIFG
jgi:hypothetical protein